MWVTWGGRHVLAHKTCKRGDLVTYAADLGVFPVDDPSRTDQQLIEAVAAEKLAAEWLERVEKLPSDEAKHEAWRRLARRFTEPSEEKI